MQVRLTGERLRALEPVRSFMSPEHQSWGPRPGGAAEQPVKRSGCLMTIAAIGVLIGLSMLGGSGGTVFWGLVFIVVGLGYLTAPGWRRWGSTRQQQTIHGHQPDALVAASDRPVELLRE